MIFLLAAFSVVHIAVFVFLFVSWRRIPLPLGIAVEQLQVSVLVPTRNEEQNLPVLFHSLESLDLSGVEAEFVFIDDHSEDRSAELIEDFIEKTQLNVRIVRLQAGKEGKKIASTTGVKNAKFNTILCTDADARPARGWIKSMAAALNYSNLKMVTGPVSMSSEHTFERLQAIEFAGLIGYGASLLSRNIPAMCNGANMAYDREAFIRVGGYSGNEHIASGDDEFLLQKISARYPGKVAFLKDRAAVVQTDTKSDMQELFNQRTRWAGKWKAHKSLSIKFSAVMTFLDSLVGIALLGMLFVDAAVALLLIIFRIFAEGLYLSEVCKFFDRRLRLLDLLLISLIYPFYVFILGFASVLRGYNWKGREYKQVK